MNELIKALQAYQLTFAHLQRVANPEDWATYGDWETLNRQANEAIAKVANWWNPEETRANASLIAAAPELLKALKTISSAAEFSEEWDNEDEKFVTIHRDYIKSVRAAIAKAKGG